jgi:hypothetical protein
MTIAIGQGQTLKYLYILPVVAEGPDHGLETCAHSKQN